MKVLIVDDNENNLYMLETLLRGNGYEVDSARNGLEALDSLGKQGADLIISDILMPKMDGFQLCRSVRGNEAFRKIPFIFYSATYTDPKDIALGISLGADRFLIKPLDPDVLLQAIIDVSTERLVVSSATDHPLGEEMEFFRQYNETLFRKLEKKIHDLESANQALSESEARFRANVRQMTAILNNIPDMAWLKDTESRYIAVNAPFGKACGHTPEELVGKTDLDIWPKDLANHYRSDDVEVMRSKISKRVEERLVGVDGKELWIETIKTPVFDADGKVTGTTGIARDITERILAERERASLEEQLRHAQKMEVIGRLAGGVAHDFNNMLGVILGYAALLNAESAVEIDRDEALLAIETAARRAKDITRQLLAFSRKQVISPQPLALNTALSESQKMYARLLCEDITLTFQLAPDLGLVKMDSSQVDQILLNLVANARDAMMDGGEMTITTEDVILDDAFCRNLPDVTPGPYVMLTARDTGCGMNHDTLEHVFEPFFTTKGVGKGVGLGLATVYGIIKQNNGHIEVASEPGKGTIFKLYFPRLMEEFWGSTIKEQPDGAPTGHEKILLVEDEKMLRDLLAQMLKALGYHVLEAASSEEALSFWAEEKKPPDLLITDVLLPGISGCELSKQLQAQQPGIKTLFISGFTGELVAQKGVLKEGMHFLEKPFTMAEVAKKIKTVLRS